MVKNAPLFSPVLLVVVACPSVPAALVKKGGNFFTRDCSWLALSFLFKSKLIQFM